MAESTARIIDALIISDEHRYVFIEQPHTACTAIQAELRELYGGREVLWKHATYADFLRMATPEQKRYFMFSGIRNPLDEAVSFYFKFKTDHRGKYSKAVAAQKATPALQAAYGVVASGNADFATYLRRVYRRPYDNDTLIRHKQMDAVIRFEHVQEDLAATLARLGLAQVRPLPLVNPTAERGSFLDYYGADLRPHAARVFGPFMRKWGYELPAGWTETVPVSATIEFRLLGIPRYIVRRYLRRPANPVTRLAGKLLMPIWRSATRRLSR